MLLKYKDLRICLQMLVTYWPVKSYIPDTPASKFFLIFFSFHTASNGVDVRTIASRIGHAKPTTTINVYGHMLRESDQIASDSLEKRILKGKDEQPANAKS